VISIEAFPVNIISNLPDDILKASTSSDRRGDESFTDVFSSLPSRRSCESLKYGDRERIKVFEKSKRDSLQPSADQTPAANLVGVRITHPEVKHQSQNNSECFPNGLGQSQINTQNVIQNVEKDTAPSLKDVLLQLGFAQEDVNSFTSAKGTDQIKELLLKLGLDLSEAEDFTGMKPGILESEKEAFHNKLMDVLQQKGLSAGQAREIGEMLTKLKMECVQVDRLAAVKNQPQDGIRDLLLQLGINPEEGEVPLDKLSKIFLGSGMNAEGLHDMVKAGKMPIHDLKAFLLRIGINPEDVDKILELGKRSGEEVFLRDLNAKIQNSQDKGIASLSEKDTISTHTGSKAQNGEVHIDLNDRGQVDINSIAGRGIEGEKARVDFEQMMSKIESRESTAQKVMGQIVKGAKVQVESGQTEAKISLHPPSLGKLNLHIITKDDQVRVTFFAETTHVKEIIENNLHQLRQSFLQQGLKVEHFNVFVGNHPDGNQTEQHSSSNSVKDHRLENEGLDGENSVALGNAKRWSSGNYTVDLFV
jgi:hypothetical protein